MHKLVTAATVAGMLCTLAGCEPPIIVPPHVMAMAPSHYHDVAYYDTHPLERSQTNAWCSNNPGLAAKTPSCDSADTSGIHAWHRKMGWE